MSRIVSHVLSTCGLQPISHGSPQMATRCTSSSGTRVYTRNQSDQNAQQVSSLTSGHSGEGTLFGDKVAEDNWTFSQNLQTITRRASLFSFLGCCMLLGAPDRAWAGGNPAVTRGLGKYVKKKKLDKIDTYLPPLFLARDQLIRVGRVMLQSPSEARELLRSGAFSGLRENIRSVGEYVSRDKEDEALGKKLVAKFFSELEAVDFQLLSATRSTGENSGLDVEATRTRLDGSIAALDELVGQVPKDIVEKARSIATAVDALDVEAATYDLDEESRIKKLI